MKVNIEVELSVQDMMDLLCTAFEGGVNYWVTSIYGKGGDTSKLPEGRTKVEHEYEWLAIGGRLTIGWKGEDSDNHFELNHGFLYQRNLSVGKHV